MEKDLDKAAHKMRNLVKKVDILSERDNGQTLTPKMKRLLRRYYRVCAVRYSHLENGELPPVYLRTARRYR